MGPLRERERDPWRETERNAGERRTLEREEPWREKNHGERRTMEREPWTEKNPGERRTLERE